MFSAMRFLIALFSGKMGQDERRCRCGGFLWCHKVVFVFISVHTRHEVMLIMQHPSAQASLRSFTFRSPWICNLFIIGREPKEVTQGETWYNEKFWESSLCREVPVRNILSQAPIGKLLLSLLHEFLANFSSFSPSLLTRVKEK